MDKVYTIQSVDRALQILELFEDGDREMSLSQIACEMQLNKSTVFGLVGTLRDRGYLDQNPENTRYRLGIKLFKLGSIVEVNLDAREVARPVLKLLSDKHKASAMPEPTAASCCTRSVRLTSSRSMRVIS